MRYVISLRYLENKGHFAYVIDRNTGECVAVYANVPPHAPADIGQGGLYKLYAEAHAYRLNVGWETLHEV